MNKTTLTSPSSCDDYPGWSGSTITNVNAFDSPLDPYSLGHQKYDAYSFALNHIHTFNPKTLLNVSLGYITNPVCGGNGVLAAPGPSELMLLRWDTQFLTPKN